LHVLPNVLEDVCQGYYERSYKLVFQECRDYFFETGDPMAETYSKKQKMKYYDDEAYLTFRDGDESEQLEKVTRDNLEEKMDQLRALMNALGK